MSSTVDPIAPVDIDMGGKRRSESFQDRIQVKGASIKVGHGPRVLES